MPRFVILRHDHPDGLHWDLMLETGDVLATWALDALPEPGTSVEARRLPDHRTRYLDYEGPVSGNRGSVTRWDAGEYEVFEIDEGRWELTLQGSRVRGPVLIEPIAGKAGQNRLLLKAE